MDLATYSIEADSDCKCFEHHHCTADLIIMAPESIDTWLMYHMQCLYLQNRSRAPKGMQNRRNYSTPTLGQPVPYHS